MKLMDTGDWTFETGSRMEPTMPRNMPPAAPGYQRYREMTVDELLLENRVIFLVGEINHASATGVIMRMLYLSNQKKDQEINLYINSFGGSLDDTLAIYDTMRYLPCAVGTTCIGRAMSGAALILAAGAKDSRHILPHAKVMIHQPYGGVTGQASDVEIQAEEILKAGIDPDLAIRRKMTVKEIRATARRAAQNRRRPRRRTSRAIN